MKRRFVELSKKLPEDRSGDSMKRKKERKIEKRRVNQLETAEETV